MALDSKDEIARRLAALAGWELSGKEIRRVYTFPDFKGGLTDRDFRLAGQIDS
jgi:pterin-4a-carbinolamine dehydratase